MPEFDVHFVVFCLTLVALVAIGASEDKLAKDVVDILRNYLTPGAAPNSKPSRKDDPASNPNKPTPKSD